MAVSNNDNRSKSLDIIEQIYAFINPNDKKEYVLIEQETLNLYPKNPCAKNQHIFELDTEKMINKSCCGKFEVTPNRGDNYGDVLTAPKMRKKVADIGRSVCGTCVSALYGDDDQKKESQ